MQKGGGNFGGEFGVEAAFSGVMRGLLFVIVLSSTSTLFL
jgi:hypothetical protein